MKTKNYTESGNTALIGLLIGNAIILSIAAILGMFYSLLLKLNFAPYFNVFILAAILVVFGKVGGIAFRIGHFRAKSKMKILIGIHSFIMLYYSWVCYIMILGDEPLGITDILKNLFQFDYLIVQIPFVFEYAGQYNAPFNSELLIISSWIIEAIMFIVIPLYILNGIKTHPYSEKSNRWYKEYLLKTLFERIALKTVFQQEIEQDVVKAINALKKGDPINHCRISIFYDDTEEAQYVSIENVIQRKNNKTKDQVIHLVEIPKSAAQDLMAIHHAKRSYLSFL